LTKLETYAILHVGFSFNWVLFNFPKEGTMKRFFMRDVKNSPKFTAKAVSLAVNGRPSLFFLSLFLAFIAVGTIEKGSLLVGITIALIAVAAGAYAMPRRFLGGGS
jgi:hypothetical protein